MDSPTTAISLFAGIGGIDLGLGLAVPGLRTVCYVEREAYCCEVLATRMEEGYLAPAPIWTDVTTFDGRPWRGLVDCITGGFPCQDISSAGKRAGIEGERSGLWFEYARIIREVGPRYVFVENVAALVQRGLSTVLGTLADLGFDAEWDVFSAAEVGAPHKRERVFILAYANQGGRSEYGKRYGDSESDSANRRTRGPNANGCDPVVAHANRAEREPQAGRRERLQECGYTEQAGIASAQRPGYAFPPGPSDLDGWARVLAEMPEIEPAICRYADGIAGRVDRLRAGGNAVVPDVACLAWTVLYERLAGGGLT